MRDALKNCGIKALTVSIQTLCGPRKPDLLCENAGKYPIEAKFTERKLVDAIAKIQNDYLKFYKTLGIKGEFALLYPEELSQPMPLDIVKELALKFRFKVIAIFLPEDVRKNFTVHEGNISDIAKILAKHIPTRLNTLKPALNTW